MLIRAFCVSVCVCLMIAANVRAQTECFWELVATDGPPARTGHAMAFDAARGEVVLFGGKGAQLFGDTWVWDGSAWRLAASGGPAPRQLHGMAYDPLRDVVVLVGGQLADATASRETWTWDGTEWALKGTGGFGTCIGFAVCFDAALGGVLLVGGIQDNGRVLDQAVVWNGSDWSGVAPFLDQRFAQGMAFFDDRSETILFGGSGNAYVHDEHTWALRNGTWELRADSGPIHREWPAMSYYGETHGVVMFGGRDQVSNILGDTWIWDGAWTQVGEGGPSARDGSAFAYDSAHRVLVLFGGNEIDGRVGDTWAFTCPTCDVDLNGDGIVNSQDFIMFLGYFVFGDPAADFNQDGVVDSQDFIAFLNAFVVGC